MEKQKVFTSILLSLMLMLTACSPASSIANSTSAQDLSAPYDPDTSTKNAHVAQEPQQHEKPKSIDGIEDEENARVVEETRYYKIIHFDFLYYYWIYNEDHDVVEASGPLNRSPHISMVNDHLVKLIFSAGPQKSTTGGYYYDLVADVFSETFESIHSEYDGKVACGMWRADLGPVVFVQDIFDKTKYYKEITSFQESFAKTVDPIRSAEFIDGGTSIRITYLTGLDFKEVTEIFKLK